MDLDRPVDDVLNHPGDLQLGDRDVPVCGPLAVQIDRAGRPEDEQPTRVKCYPGLGEVCPDQLGVGQ